MNGFNELSAERPTDIYFKLEPWIDRNSCWANGKRGYETELAARLAARKPGRYRITRVESGIRVEVEHFEIKK